MEKLFEQEYPFKIYWNTPIRARKGNGAIEQYYGSYRAALLAWENIAENMLPGEELKLYKNGQLLLESKKP